MVAQKITHIKNPSKIEQKHNLEENKKNEGRNKIKTSLILRTLIDLYIPYDPKILILGTVIIFMVPGEAEYVNKNFAPSHLQELYLAEFSNVLSENNKSSKCSDR